MQQQQHHTSDVSAIAIHPPTYCGNVWMMAATIAISLVAAESREPHVLTIDTEGRLEAIASSHPMYEQRLLDPGFVGTVDCNSNTERLAARIRDAALRGLG